MEAFLSSHIIRRRRECTIMRYFESGSPHSHNFYYTYNCPIFTVVNLLLCLLYKLNFTLVCTYRKKPGYTGFCAISGFRHPPALGMHPLWVRGEHCTWFHSKRSERNELLQESRHLYSRLTSAPKWPWDSCFLNEPLTWREADGQLSHCFKDMVLNYLFSSHFAHFLEVRIFISGSIFP